jgi:hypothetical protein
VPIRDSLLTSLYATSARPSRTLNSTLHPALLDLLYAQHSTTCSSASNPQPPYSVIQTDVNNGYLHYNALDLNIPHSFSEGFQMLASYTWSHTLNNVDPDTTSQNPKDTNFVGYSGTYGNGAHCWSGLRCTTRRRDSPAPTTLNAVLCEGELLATGCGRLLVMRGFTDTAQLIASTEGHVFGASRSYFRYNPSHRR